MRKGFTLIELIVSIIILMGCVVGGMVIGWTTERRYFKAEAVRMGAAHYEVDADGKSQCVWNGSESVRTVTNRVILK